MHARDNAYSRFVSLAKVLLPLVGLVLLSVLFLIARAPSGPGEIPFAEIEAAAREQRLGAPRFAGTTPSGASISVEATAVRPGPEGLYEIEAPRGAIEPPGAARISLRAESGSIDTGARRLRFEGPVLVESAQGYRAETPSLEADLVDGGVVSTGEISVEAPFGRLTAGAMRTELPQDGAPRMVFSDGVRLLYEPASRGERR